MAVPVPFRLFPVSGKEILFAQDDSKFRIPQAVFPLEIRIVFRGIFPGSLGHDGDLLFPCLTHIETGFLRKHAF